MANEKNHKNMQSERPDIFLETYAFSTPRRCDSTRQPSLGFWPRIVGEFRLRSSTDSLLSPLCFHFRTGKHSDPKPVDPERVDGPEPEAKRRAADRRGVEPRPATQPAQSAGL